MSVRRCPVCGKLTRADLPAGVPRRPFGARLTAVIALLSGRYRLSRREVRPLLRDLWQGPGLLGAGGGPGRGQRGPFGPLARGGPAPGPPGGRVSWGGRRV